ncbi:Uncharacterized protein BP5553_08980 [Venustampulla echinocandica]|uniref:Mediator of RNA polymerase II transcription subunit 9 n=1 Tax=Venustampulla echinocandica TaxID=2656787 RepID=A0A370TDK9_9HELO|nr:Uncharacterized protein BP5553_08980 [Venustampulla echinocandica]RDL32524.1 Uncharacterized protein BP5553_08980 [Venustampulla echinocandica]
MTTPSQSTPQPPSITDKLSPDSIDTLPVLSALLSRLQPSSTTSTSTAGSPPAASPSQVASGTGALTIKDIPIASDEIKHKLQKARAQVKELPDIDRSISEQELEIRELEEKIAKQREVLESLRDVGVATRRDREMGERTSGADVMETT